MGNKITVKEGEKLIIELDSDTPSLEALKKYVLENRTTINLDDIKTSCDTENFDCNIFNETIKSAIKTELDNLKIQDEKLKEYIDKIDAPKE